MASYRIRFFTFRMAPGAGALAAPDQSGARFALTQAEPAAVLVEDGPTGPVVARGSLLGVVGASVTLGPRIETLAEGSTRLAAAFDLLELEGVTVGLIGPKPADCAAGLVVCATRPRKTPRQLRDLASDEGEPQQQARPRKNLFAFATGTRIDTPEGPRPVERLAPGDLVSTLGNGSQPLRWVGQRQVSPAEMALREDLRPILLDTGSMGNPAPMLVGARHRILLNDWRAQVYFGEDQVLIPAQALINGANVRQILPEAGVTYVHLLFDRHEVIVSEGALSESFHPSETGLRALDPTQRDEIEALYPGEALTQRRAAFPMLRMSEARALRLPG